MNEFYLMIQLYFTGTAINSLLPLPDFKSISPATIIDELTDAQTGGYKNCNTTRVLLDENNQATNQSITFKTISDENPPENYIATDWDTQYPISLFIAVLEQYNNIRNFYFSKGRSFDKSGNLVKTIVFMIEIKIQDKFVYYYFDYSQDPPTRRL